MDLAEWAVGALTCITLALTTWNLKTTNALQIRQSVNEALDKAGALETDRRLKEQAAELQSMRERSEKRHSAILMAFEELKERFSEIHEDLSVIKANCVKHDA